MKTLFRIIITLLFLFGIMFLISGCHQYPNQKNVIKPDPNAKASFRQP